MTETTARTAAVAGSTDEQAAGDAATVQLAVPIPRRTSRWFRHYAPRNRLRGAPMASAEGPGRA
jgi:hypothetical protein